MLNVLVIIWGNIQNIKENKTDWKYKTFVFTLKL